MRFAARMCNIYCAIVLPQSRYIYKNRKCYNHHVRLNNNKKGFHFFLALLSTLFNNIPYILRNISLSMLVLPCTRWLSRGCVDIDCFLSFINYTRADQYMLLLFIRELLLKTLWDSCVSELWWPLMRWWREPRSLITAKWDNKCFLECQREISLASS